MATILIGGGTGFIGGHLSKRLQAAGHEVRHLSRHLRPDSAYPTFVWDIKNQTIDEEAFRDLDYVINLAGAGIADARWTEKRKQLIISSRTESTRLLASSIAKLRPQLKGYLSANGIGYYGDRGEELLHEEAEAGTGFLSHSCMLWEEATTPIAAMGIPTFINRTGIVLHPEAGALEKMLIPLNFFVSTYFGAGRQHYSWIHIEDLVNTYVFAIERGLSGAYNGVAPEPVPNKEFAAALGPAMGKPALVLPAPAFIMKIVLGEMSHTVLDSTRCSADKLMGEGFEFRFPTLRAALKDLLG
jgi:uncharacterized protein (TIGR01777 family)